MLTICAMKRHWSVAGRSKCLICARGSAGERARDARECGLSWEIRRCKARKMCCMSGGSDLWRRP
jgi:hypothetical protein